MFTYYIHSVVENNCFLRPIKSQDVERLDEGKTQEAQTLTLDCKISIPYTYL